MRPSNHRQVSVPTLTRSASEGVSTGATGECKHFLSVNPELAQGKVLSPEPNPSVLVHAQDGDRRATRWSSAEDQSLAQFEVVVPVLSSRVEQTLDLTSVGIDS